MNIKITYGLLTLALAGMAQAADVYLDYNGDEPGFGVVPTSGGLDVDVQAVTWNTDPTGGDGGTLRSVQSGDQLHFGLEGSGGILFNWVNYNDIAIGGIHTYQTTGSTATINRMQKKGGGALDLNFAPGATVQTDQDNSFWWDFTTVGNFSKTGAGSLSFGDGKSKINGTATLERGRLIIHKTTTLSTNSNIRLQGGQLLIDDGIDDDGEQYLNMGVLSGNGTIARSGTNSGLNSLTLNLMGADMSNDNATDLITLGWGAAGTFLGDAQTTMDISKKDGERDQDQFKIGWSSRALTLGGDLIVRLTTDSDALSLGDSFTLFSSQLLSEFESFDLPDLDPGLEWDLSQLAEGGDGSITVIPEPATLGLIVLSSSALIWARKRFIN